MWGALSASGALMVLAVLLPALRDLLGLAPPARGEWGIVLAAAALPLAAGELWKRRRPRQRDRS
jgi:hypothetical protein